MPIHVFNRVVLTSLSHINFKMDCISQKQKAANEHGREAQKYK